MDNSYSAIEKTVVQPTQRVTLIRLCGVLVSEWNGRPGAIEADVPAFLDFFVGKSLPDVQLLYREVLTVSTPRRKPTQQALRKLGQR